ncbi:MAG: RNA polymerase sigma factor [Alcanivoracaceae bacterium]|nr:RNA polymerase sigma factor [Alcanivoracaceae bacterium]
MSDFAKFSDKQLVALVQITKDHNAFTELVIRHQATLCAFLYRFSGNQFQAEDLTQETFIKSYNNISKFNQESTFKTWLFSIGYREFLQSKRKSNTIINMIERFKQSSNHKNSTNIEENIDLENALKNLNNQQKAAILLCDACGMSHTEASQTMDVPLGSLKTYVKQARKIMQNILGENHGR